MAKIDLPKWSGKRSKAREKSVNFENDIEWQPWAWSMALCAALHLGQQSFKYEALN